MKMKPFAVNTVIAVSLLAGGSTLALATGGEVCDKGAKQAAYNSPGRDEKPMHRVMETLDLSQAQREQIKHIVAGQRGELQNKRQALRNIRHQLYTAASGDNYDAARVNQLIEQQSRLAADMTRQRTDMIQKIYRQMTPQQQAKFQSMRHRYRHHIG
ncbi:MAG: Spy/CpxP family protein refolding chaperone [Thiohalophilus sp.]|uniref:Spy/CpxP family protein refolding chaperone n=1 Tax=Thiohalophilus sp. TaxID=3028392 RepID=UPI002870548C|nr:Spy/CpxP family protein refolding chaperone [Thiohalophilus sp.]MDR9435645.1 Spy/CpxP family protein refolding chaperone [Thiohalophilus sp.]